MDLARVKIVELGGGGTLYLQRAPPSSRISVISWIAKAGSDQDPPHKRGLAALTGRATLSGTRRKNKKELGKLLDRIAATTNADTDWDGFTIEMRGPTSSEGVLIDLLSEFLTEPSFETSELTRIKRQIEERLVRNMKQPQSLVETRFHEILFPSSDPYHWNPLGIPKTVRSLTRADVIGFQRERYGSTGSKLVITSPSSDSALIRLARDCIGSLNQVSPSSRENSNTLSDLTGGRGVEEKLTIPGSQQVSVLLGGGAPPRSDRSYCDLDMANEVLGGRPVVSRLFQVLREKEGIVYSADSTLSLLRRGGYWNVGAGTSVKTSMTASRLLLEEVQKLSRKGVSERELNEIRNSLLGSFPLILDTPESAHSLAHEIAFYDLEPDHYVSLMEGFRAVTPKSLKQAMSEKYENWEKPITILAGPGRSSSGPTKDE